MFLRLEEMARVMDKTRNREEPQSLFQLAQSGAGSDGMKHYVKRTIFFYENPVISIYYCFISIVIIYCFNNVELYDIRYYWDFNNQTTVFRGRTLIYTMRNTFCLQINQIEQATGR